jgi:hypothetical protein
MEMVRDGLVVRRFSREWGSATAFALRPTGGLAVVGHQRSDPQRWRVLFIDIDGKATARVDLPAGRHAADPVFVGGGLLVRLHGLSSEGLDGEILRVTESGFQRLLHEPGALQLVGFDRSDVALVRSRDRLTLLAEPAGRVLWRRSLTVRPFPAESWTWCEQQDDPSAIAVLASEPWRRGQPMPAVEQWLLDAATGTTQRRSVLVPAGNPATASQSFRKGTLTVQWGPGPWPPPLPSLDPAAAEPLWLMANGTHEMLQGWEHPLKVFQGVFYQHQGLDVRATGDVVVATRSGSVRLAKTGGTLLIGGTLGVEVSPGGEYDWYTHLDLGPWNVGDSIQAGDVLGTVGRYYGGAHVDHVHYSRVSRYTGGDTYKQKFTLNPLALFASRGDRDPQGLAAGPYDADGDGVVFRVVKSVNNRKSFDFAWGSVDLVLEATDRQNTTLGYGQNPFSIAYWIEPLSVGESVHNGGQPYVLFRIDDAWEISCVRCERGAPGQIEDPIVKEMLLTADEFTVDQGGTGTPWPSLANYKITNTKGSTGLPTEVDQDQFWRTDARQGSGSSGNGSDALGAREIHEARFPDGRYLVETLVSDLVQDLRTAFPVVVDNFRPYVKRVELYSGSFAVYRARWEWNSDSKELQYRFLGRDGPANPDRDLRLVVEFSEPVLEAEVTRIQPDLGFLPRLRSDQSKNRKTLWGSTIPAAHLTAGRWHRLHIACTDLNGTTLFSLSDREPQPANFNKRFLPSPITDSTEDTVHGFRVGLTDH